MKAILVVDLGNADSDYYYIDYVVRSKEIRNTLMCGYNVNLKPMPQKLDANDWHRMFSGTYKEREAKGYGYNACIDKLLGEE